MVFFQPNLAVFIIVIFYNLQEYNISKFQPVSQQKKNYFSQKKSFKKAKSKILESPKLKKNSDLQRSQDFTMAPTQLMSNEKLDITFKDSDDDPDGECSGNMEKVLYKNINLSVRTKNMDFGKFQGVAKVIMDNYLDFEQKFWH